MSYHSVQIFTNNRDNITCSNVRKGLTKPMGRWEGGGANRGGRLGSWRIISSMVAIRENNHPSYQTKSSCSRQQGKSWNSRSAANGFLQRKRKWFLESKRISFARNAENKVKVNRPFWRCVPDWCVPERKVSDVPSFGLCAPWPMRPLDDVSLGRRVPLTLRPWPMCPKPGPHQGPCRDKLVWVRLV